MDKEEAKRILEKDAIRARGTDVPSIGNLLTLKQLRKMDGKLEDDNGHTVTNNHMVVCAPVNYCPVCGRPLTPEAWEELERRING